MVETSFPKLHFGYDYDERRADETKLRGYISDVTVELADGTRHPVYFYDPVRLSQDLEVESQCGRPFVAEKGMIVLNEVTLENMMVAVRWLAEHDFFSKGIPGQNAC